MRKLMIIGLLVGAALSVSSCGKKSSAGGTLGKGQVVASVDGDEITIYELNAELDGLNLPSAAARKQAEQTALQRIIDRKILTGIARERKLDKTPQYLLQTRRADETLLVNLLQQDVVSKTPPVTSEEVEKFIAGNPSLFGERKLLVIDQIQFPMPRDRNALMAFQPLKTLDQVEQKLIKDNIEYRRVPTSIDTLQLSPQMARKILALPAGEVFIVPSGGQLTANHITETRSIPLLGPEATKVAQDMVRKQKAAEKAETELEPLIEAARQKVVYQQGYKPSAPNKPVAPAAGPGDK